MLRCLAATTQISERPVCFGPYLYRARNLIKRFFNKIKQCRRVATRYDKLAANYLAFVKLASSEFGCVLMSPHPSSQVYLVREPT